MNAPEEHSAAAWRAAPTRRAARKSRAKIRIDGAGGDDRSAASAPAIAGKDGHLGLRPQGNDDITYNNRRPLKRKVPAKPAGDDPVVIAEPNSWQAKRIAHGFASAYAFARAAGVKTNTYYAHESGRRAVSPETAAHYNQVLERTQPLMTKTITETQREIPVVASIPAIAELTARAEVVRGVVSVDLSKLVAAPIADESMMPMFGVGDVVLYEPLVRRGFDIAALDGRESIVELASGETLLCICSRREDGTVVLERYHGEALRVTASLIVAGSPVRLIQRRR